jgi:hypothetical protein
MESTESNIFPLNPKDNDGFLKRMEAIFARTATTSEKLQELYKENDTDALNEMIDGVVYELVVDDTEWHTNLQKIKEARQYHDESSENALATRQKELKAMYRVLVVNEANLPDEARFSEIEQARNAVANTLRSQPEPITSTAQALELLDIVKTEDDTQIFRFPTELMPPSVTEKWETYLAAVCNHAKVANENVTLDNRYRVKEADTARKYAHNSVTTDVNAILNFEAIDPQWSFEDTRTLLGHVRDSVFKSYESLFTPEAQHLMDSHSSGVHASTVLSSRAHRS